MLIFVVPTPIALWATQGAMRNNLVFGSANLRVFVMAPWGAHNARGASRSCRPRRLVDGPRRHDKKTWVGSAKPSDLCHGAVGRPQGTGTGMTTIHGFGSAKRKDLCHADLLAMWVAQGAMTKMCGLGSAKP